MPVVAVYCNGLPVAKAFQDGVQIWPPMADASESED